MTGKLLTSILLTTCLLHVHCNYDDRAKIRTSGGNLYLEPARGKNIYLRTNGPHSSIFLGDVNLINVTSRTSGPSKSLSDDVDTHPYTSNDVLRRLQALENLNLVPYDDFVQNISALSLRISRLSSRVNRLQRQNYGTGDKCQLHTCRNGGTCLNLVGDFHCLCPSNWEGRNCEIDVNECRNFAGTDLGCQNGADCINKPGTYECQCKMGWFGTHCIRRKMDCSAGNSEMCGHGTCVTVSSGEGIKCICDQGWTSNSSVACLTDLNECDTSLGPRCSTSPKVECINLPGSFRCGQCPQGFQGDGYVCYDIDECASSNGGCSSMVSCHNTIGSRICGACPPDFIGDGVTCTWRGSCSVDHGGCHPSARCVESPGLAGGVQCECPQGMDGDGVGLHGCYVTTDNGTKSCESDPCGLYGRCHMLRNGYTCFCLKGYTGAHCDVQSRSCAINPCKNGGVCKPDDTAILGFKCECTAQYTGTLCQERSHCGSILRAEVGNLIYSLTNVTDGSSSKCAWIIRTVPEKVINVTFTRFNLERSPDCTFNFLQLHDGRSTADPLIGRFCGNEAPNGGHVLSSQHNLYLWFLSNSGGGDIGFALHWNSVAPVCGGEVNATIHGSISSPGSPGRYPSNRDCYWHLSATLSKRIQLHFFQLDLETHDNCSFDYLAIYDGQQVTNQLLEKYCSSTQPAPLLSTGPEIMIHFHSDAHGNGKGFQITYAPAEGVPGCGGFFSGDRGEVSSPSYDGSYLSNLLCEYKIRTRPDTQIQLDFKLFKLERFSNCKHDYLKIYDGSSTESPLLGTYCGELDRKIQLYSTSNYIFIVFRSDRSRNREGFKIGYKVICKYFVHGDSGVIKSPGYPFSYPNNIVCEYVIETSPGKAIQLAFQDFDVEGNLTYNCDYDKVEVRDGLNANYMLLGNYCGNGIPPTQTSSFNIMYVRFSSDMSQSGGGFYANFTSVDIVCGGIYRNPTSTIVLYSDRSYPRHNQTCTWIILAPAGKYIHLNWNRFQLESTILHVEDCLEISMIDDDNDKPRKFCGANTPPTMTMPTNSLKLKIVPKIDYHNIQLSLTYTLVDAKDICGGTFVQNHGIIYSPGWPNSYSRNLDCVWVIHVPTGQQIKLNISQFDIERPNYRTKKCEDFLRVRNGMSASSLLIGEYCGQFNWKSLTSTANSLHITFHSDFYLGGKGFKIQWDSTITGCGGTFTGYTGSISSPNYPSNYDENSECFYRIVTSQGSRISLKFLAFEFETLCNDYVEIYDGRDPESRSLGQYCKRPPENIETTSNYAFIKFRSNFAITGKGFLLSYTTICNNTVTGYYGVIESLNYPNSYPPGLNCTWLISVPKGSKINVTVANFDVRYNSLFYSKYLSRDTIVRHYCALDYLLINEPGHINNINKLCGTSKPTQISTTGNLLNITFITEDIGLLQEHSGFRLEWLSYGCRGHIKKSKGFLNKTLSSSDQMECEWLIETPVGRRIKLIFAKLYMVETNNCTTDAIEIYNGPTDRSPLLAKICHISDTAIVTSTSNYVLVKLNKKSSLRDVHFASRFTNMPSTCGGYLKTHSGEINSKNYPKNYDNNLNCIWRIRVPDGHHVTLEFNDIDLNNKDDKCDDFVKLYDNIDDVLNTNYTHIICNNSARKYYTSKNSLLAVQFVTNAVYTAKGFKASFAMTCGSVIKLTENSENGVITNDNIISHSNSSCVWTILAPKLEQKVSLTITHLSLPIDNGRRTNQTCPDSYLRVLDGDDEKAPLIDEYCGRAVPATIVSRGSVLTVQLGTNGDKITGVFSAYYSTVDAACGGTFTSESGVIASPNYPARYPLSAVCEWKLKTSPGNRVAINIDMLDISYSEECNEDYLEIRENDGAGRILGLYCGSVLPVNATSASQLYIKFHSDNKNPGRGFLINYNFVHGNDITDLNEGEIASPLYPRPYDGSGEFWWRVTSGNEAINIEVDKLQINSYSELCEDNLSIYDGHDDEAPLLKNLCGALHNTIEVIRTSSNVAYMKLTLNEANRGALFHLRWSQGDRDIDQITNKPNCGNNSTVIVMPGRTTTFSSPNYPQLYDNDLNCEWVFKATYGRHLSLKFVDFDIEEREPCTNGDTVSIFESDVPAVWKLVKENICLNSDTQHFFYGSKFLKIIFKTDNSYIRKGFMAHVGSLCGAVLTDPSGVIESNRYDFSFATPPYRCDWKVKVHPGRRIRLVFYDFNINNEENDCKVYIVLHNGESRDSPRLSDGKYCGYSHENKSATTTSGNYLFVSYIRGMKNPKQTFKLHYEEVLVNCGMTSELSADNPWEIINSPNYPNVPDPYTECNWLLTGPIGEILRVDFIERFDIYKEEDCLKEFVEIHDGTSTMSPIRGHFCGENPGTIKTTDNSVLIKYVTERAEPNNGFKANVSIDVCGGTISASQGEVISPGYPSSIHLPPGTICEWHIIGLDGHILLIKPEQMNLPQSESLCGTKVTIEELEPVTKINDLLKTYCPQYFPSSDDLSVVKTSENEVTVTLYIGISSNLYDNTATGFRLTFESSETSCGESLTTAEGYITTPGYPKSIKNRFCLWIIETPDPSRRITLEILDASKISLYVNLGQLIVFNNEYDKTSSNTTFKSFSNEMELFFDSFQQEPIKFKARFSSYEQAVCGGFLSGISGQLKSPDSNDAYYCKWNYQVKTNVLDDDDNKMSLYKSMFITGTVNSYDYYGRILCRNIANVVLKYSLPRFRTYVETYCNEEVSYIVPFTNIDIMATKKSFQNLNFDLQWKIQPCGGIVHLDKTPINVINIEQPYNDTLNCGWLLKSENPGPTEIKLEGNFQLNCADEFVKIRHLTHSLNLIFNYCKDKVQTSPQVISLSDIFIEYHVKVQNSSNVKILVRTVEQNCGGRLKYMEKFSSPNFPKDYNSNLECEWDIVSLEKGFRVSLQFINRFVIEKSPNCTKDAVIIYDWKDDNYIEVARLCGRELPPVFNSTYDRVKVVLRTDNETNLEGFEASWTRICGGTYNATTTEQYLYSPGYPFYFPSMTCNYKISARDGKLQIKFLYFDLEGDAGTCENDNLTISTSTKHFYFFEIYCGNEIPKITSMFSDVELVFNSDSSVQKLGFKMAYSLYSCGGHITQPTTISSGPHGSYNNNINCTWLIEAPKNKKIVLKVVYFQLEQSYECMNDYLAAYEGQNTDIAKRLALICGDIKSSTAIPSIGNTMTVEFVTDAFMQKKGFKLDVVFTYSETVGCGGVINITTSPYTLSSPHINSQNSYENFLDCHWNILAPLDHVIKVSFSSFHIASCRDVNQTALGFNKCDCDFLQIKDGVTPDSLIIGTYCGHTLPAEVISSRNTMSVRLSTDGEITSSGFTATLIVQESACGPTLLNVSRSVVRVKSPGYDTGSVARGIHCMYHFISSSSYQLMHIHFNDFDVQSGANDATCDKDKIFITSVSLPIGTSLGEDYIQGSNGGSTLGSAVFTYYSFSSNTTTPEQYLICGSKKSVDLYVTGSFAMNVITSPDELSRRYRGVDVEVSIVGFCGRNFTELYARVANNYDFDLNKTKDDCYTLISAPNNYTISIYFNTYTANLFSNAYLDIHDGNTTTSPKLVSLSKQHVDYTTNPLFSKGKYVLLHNHFSGLNNMITYDFTYIATDKGRGCGGYFYGAEGTVTSPLYPAVYRQVKTCEWELETPHHTRVSLHFDAFDLGRDCEHTYMQLVDRAGAVLSSYCEETPAVFTSDDNYVKVVFVTSRNNGGTGWVAKFISVL